MLRKLNLSHSCCLQLLLEHYSLIKMFTLARAE